MSKYRITLVLPIMVLSGLVFSEIWGRPAFAQGVHMSRISGTLLDSHDARIADAEVTIENPRFRRSLRSSDDGGFQLDVPADTYKISFAKDGFMRFVLASYQASSHSKSKLTIHMRVKPPEVPLKINKTGTRRFQCRYKVS